MAATRPDSTLSAEQVLQSLGHAVIVTDLAGVVKHWNPAAERLYGWTVAEALGRNIATLTVPRVTQSLAEEIMQTLRSGGQWSGGFSVQRKDGSTFPALVTDTGVHDSSGELVGVVGVSTDLAHALRPLLAQSSDAALVLTGDARVSFISPAAMQMFGWTDERALGAGLPSLVHADDRRSAIEYYGRVIASRDPTAPLECRLLRPDGSWCWVELLMTNFFDDPVIRGVVCNVRDITERRNDRDQLLRLTEQLENALTSRTVIEQAKGLIAGRTGADLASAFAALRRYSRDHNMKLHDVARAVVSGNLSPPL